MATAAPAPVQASVILISAVVVAIYVIHRLNALHFDGQQEAAGTIDSYQLIAEYCSDLITCHGAGGQCSYASPSAAKLLGTEPDALLGQGFMNQVHVSDRPMVMQAFSSTMFGGQTKSVRFRMKQNSGTSTGQPSIFSNQGFIWMEMQSSLGEGDSIFQQLVCVSRDVSSAVEIEENLSLARTEAESASEAKSHFLASVSHEFRTPLNAIIGFSEILSTDNADLFGQDRKKEYAALINESGSHLLQLVNDILDLSKLESGKFDLVLGNFEPNGLIKSCVDTLALQAGERQVTVNLALSESVGEVSADSRAVRQIVFNLLGNAIKFSEPQGNIAVRLAPRGKNFRLEVQDDGPGIAKELLPLLGQPFVRADNSYNRKHEGTGLGLSVVAGLVKLHGGELKIDSAPGQGTTVTVELPSDGESVKLAQQNIKPAERVVELQQARPKLSPAAPLCAQNEDKRSA
jgi:cell cycle sensor histidine kinase DivJ